MTTESAPPGGRRGLVPHVVRFVRHLREAGLPLGPSTAALLLEAAAHLGPSRPADVRDAFRALVCRRRPDLERFDAAWDLFFGGGGDLPGTLPSETRGLRVSRAHRRTASVPLLRPEGAGAPDLRPAETADARTGASDVERLRHRDFARLDPSDAAEVRRLMARMVWRPADARSRRSRPSRRRGRPDPRRTLRNLVRPEGALLPPALAERRPRRRPLLVLADISGSMERYTEMLLHFVHAARGRLGRLEAFVFSTRLTRVTREMAHPDPDVALRRVGAVVEDWAGGTRIGDALRAFNWEWSRRVTRGGPVALLISDGWDRGDPAVLEEEVARLARSVHRLVWLNPLAGRPGYRPETRGMRIVLPHVHDHLAATSLADLEAVVDLLESLPPTRGARAPGA